MIQINNITEHQVIDCLRIYMEDPQLNVWHLAILNAILSLGYRQGERQRIKVSRRKLMLLSHIKHCPLIINISNSFRIWAILSKCLLIILVIEVMLNYFKRGYLRIKITSFFLYQIILEIIF